MRHHGDGSLSSRWRGDIVISRMKVEIISHIEEGRRERAVEETPQRVGKVLENYEGKNS
jgi:hypothetical protein